MTPRQRCRVRTVDATVRAPSLGRDRADPMSGTPLSVGAWDVPASVGPGGRSADDDCHLPDTERRRLGGDAVVGGKFVIGRDQCRLFFPLPCSPASLAASRAALAASRAAFFSARAASRSAFAASRAAFAASDPGSFAHRAAVSCSSCRLSPPTRRRSTPICHGHSWLRRGRITLREEGLPRMSGRRRLRPATRRSVPRRAGRRSRLRRSVRPSCRQARAR